MRKALLFFVSLCTAFAFVQQANAQCNDLFFSEYVEGSQNNKALEIYNPTDQAIDLANYQIIRWDNGSNIAAPIETANALSGSVAAKDVLVITSGLGVLLPWDPADSTIWESLEAKADLFLCNDCDPNTSNLRTMCFNGNDALSLHRKDNAPTPFGNIGTILDIIGLIGEDPGQSWTDTAPYTESAGGAYWTRDQTIYRKRAVRGGVLQNPGQPYTGAFNPTAEWDTLPRNDFSHLGWHECECGNTPNGIADVVQHTRLIYPNPANNFILVSSKDYMTSIELVSITGQVVSHTQSSGTNQARIELDAPIGLYTVKITYADRSVSFDKVNIQ